MTALATVRCKSKHPIDLTGGHIMGFNDVYGPVDLDNPHEYDMWVRGILVIVAGDPPTEVPPGIDAPPNIPLWGLFSDPEDGDTVVYDGDTGDWVLTPIGAGGGGGGAPDAVAATALGKNPAGFGSRHNVPLIYDEDYYWWWVPIKIDGNYEDAAMPGWTVVDHMDAGLPDGYGTILVPPADKPGAYQFGCSGYLNVFGSTDWPLVQGVKTNITSALTGKRFPTNIEASLILIGKNADGDSEPNWGEFYEEFDYPNPSNRINKLGDTLQLNISSQVQNVGRPDNDPDDGARSVYGFGFAVRDHGGHEERVRIDSQERFAGEIQYAGITLDLSTGPKAAYFPYDSGPNFDGIKWTPPAGGYDAMQLFSQLQISGHDVGDRFQVSFAVFGATLDQDGVTPSDGTPWGTSQEITASSTDPIAFSIEDVWQNGPVCVLVKQMSGTPKSVNIDPMPGGSGDWFPFKSIFKGYSLAPSAHYDPAFYGDGSGNPELEAMTAPAFTATYFQLQAHRIGPGTT